MPAAPAAFSTMTRWPSDAVRRSAITRATMSVGPPAPNGTMMVIGLLGNGWACACGMIDNAIAAQARDVSEYQEINHAAMDHDASSGGVLICHDFRGAREAASMT